MSAEFPKSPGESSSTDTPTFWNVCAARNIFCSKVHGTENYAVFGGKGVEINVWDLERCTKIWNAKSPAKNSLGIFTPTWFTSATFLSNNDHRKFVAGTNSHQITNSPAQRTTSRNGLVIPDSSLIVMIAALEEQSALIKLRHAFWVWTLKSIRHQVFEWLNSIRHQVLEWLIFGSSSFLMPIN